MPNWCNNIVVVRNSDPAKIQSLIDALQQEKFFDHIIPIGDWEYDKACNAWSTKWEASNISWMKFNVVDAVELSFESAWCPPENVYKQMVEDGWEVTAYYCEPGMGFVGKFTTQDGFLEDESYDFNETMPNEFIDMFALDDFFDDQEFVDNGDGTSTLQEIVDESTE
jgi:hypothetical protein